MRCPRFCCGPSGGDDLKSLPDAFGSPPYVAGVLCACGAGSVVYPAGPFTVEGFASAAPGLGAVCGVFVLLCADATEPSAMNAARAMEPKRAIIADLRGRGSRAAGVSRRAWCGRW